MGHIIIYPNVEKAIENISVEINNTNVTPAFSSLPTSTVVKA
jgi:hypothetical protein